MSAAELPAPIVLPCGCRFDCQVIDGVNTLILTACPAGESCTYVQYALEESRRQGNETTVVDAS